MRIFLLFIFIFIMITGFRCGEPPKSENQVFIESLDSMATEGCTFVNTNDSSQKDSFATAP